MSIPVIYWSDPLCIWAYVAADKISRLLERHGAELELEHRVVPVFGSVPWRFSQGSWAAAGPEGRMAATLRVARRFGHDEVSARAWVDDPPATTWAPSAAAKALSLIEARDEAEKGSTGRYLQALRRAFFVDDRNIARRSEQRAVANALGLPWQAMEDELDSGAALASLWEDHQERERLGVQGSPTWVFDGGRAMLYGNVSEGVLRATVDELIAGSDHGQSRC